MRLVTSATERRALETARLPFASVEANWRWRGQRLQRAGLVGVVSFGALPLIEPSVNRDQVVNEMSNKRAEKRELHQRLTDGVPCKQTSQSGELLNMDLSVVAQ